MQSTKKKTIDSLKWSSVEKLGQFALQLIISIVLARLLDATEYALIGILNIFITIVTVLIDAGFSQGLIRKVDCTKDHYNAVFWFNLLMSITLYGLLYVLMPYFATIFNDPYLIPTGRVLMLMVPLQALNVVQTTIVNKELKFKQIAFYTIVSTPIAGAIGITLALLDYGVWALIWQTLTYTLLTVIIFWARSDWKPSLRINFKPMKDLMTFSLQLSASSFLNVVFNNISPFAIAKLFSKADFGFYSQAYKYATMPTNLLESILNRMTYPVLSKLQDNMPEYRNAYIKMLSIMCSFILPLMVCMILCGREGIKLVLGEKWVPAIPYFQILCFAAMTMPFHPLAMSNLKVFGKSGLIFKLEIVKKVLIVTSVALSIPWGIYGLVWGQTIYFWLALIINLYFGGKQINYSGRQQLKNLMPIILLSIIAFIPAFYMQFVFENLILTLLIKVIIFVIIYGVGILLIPLPQFHSVKSLINKR